jgi:Cys-rich protein (TIGR01571 family)
MTSKQSAAPFLPADHVQSNQWSYGLCSCFDDPCFLIKMYCCVSPHHCGICCCPFIYATAYEKALNKDYCCTCLLGFFGCLCYREHLVKKYQIRESRCMSCFYGCFCPMCSVVQEIREIELRENGRISTCNARCPPTVFKMHRANSPHQTHTQRVKTNLGVGHSGSTGSYRGGSHPQTAKVPVAQPSQQFAVMCPPGVRQGMPVQIRTPQGQMMQVAVPAGVAPGQQFMVAY